MSLQNFPVVLRSNYRTILGKKLMNHEQPNKRSAGETTWVIGGGKFGQRGVTLLREKAPDSNIIMVEQQPVADLPLGVVFVESDGVEWLVEQLVPGSDVAKIIPAIPVHLAVEWVKRKLLIEGRIIQPLEIPETLLHNFPNPIRLSSSKCVMSHADFICPENCAEPDTLCSYTLEPRPPSLYSLIETMDCGDFVQVVIRSRQFYPGLGGFFPEDLWTLLARTRLLPDTPLLVCTACKCHGVVDTFCHGTALSVS